MRTFYTIVLTQTFSLIGSRISGLAIGIWVYNETGNATPLALVAFFGIIPQVLAASLSGALADRYDRRYVMAFSDAGQALGTALLLISFASGGFQLWHLYAVTLLQGIFGVFQSPALVSSVTMLVPDAQRDRANAILQMMGPGAGIIAPAITGLIYALIGVTGAIVIDFATFIVAMAVVLAVRIPRPEQTEAGRQMAGSIWKESLGGLRYLWARRPLFFLIAHVSLLNFLISGAGTLLTPYILARTGSEAALGIIMSVMNAGAIAGAIVFGVWGGFRPRIHTIMPGIIVAGALLMGVGMSQSAVVLGLLMLVFMLPIPAINASFMSLMQAKTAPDVQGRVFAVAGQMAMLMSPIAYLLVGPLADQVFEPAVGQPVWEGLAPLVGNQVGAGMGMILVLGGLGAALSSILVYALPAIRHLEATYPDYAPVAAEAPAEVEGPLTDVSPA